MVCGLHGEQSLAPEKLDNPELRMQQQPLSQSRPSAQGLT